MEIIGHIDDVIDDFTHLGDGETLEVPKGGWGRQGYTVVTGKSCTN